MPLTTHCSFSLDFFDLESVYSSEMAGYGSSFRPSVKGILLMIKVVLLYYDYLLTLPDEVDRLWHAGPRSWASIVFFINRYLALVGHVPFVWSVYADPCKTGVGPIRSLTLR